MNPTEVFWKNVEKVRLERGYSKGYVYHDHHILGSNVTIRRMVEIAERLNMPVSLLWDYDSLTYPDCLEMVAIKNKLATEELEELMKKYKVLKKKYC